MLHCDRIEGTVFHVAPKIASSVRTHRRFRAHKSVVLISTFGPSSITTTMPSADFCVLTPHVSMKGAIELLMSCCLFRVSIDSPPWQGGVAEGRGGRDSYPSTATEYAGSLLNRIDLFRISLMNLLSRDTQISPNKNVNFPCTNAAFTLPPNLWASFVLCLLAQGLSLICGSCSSSRTFALRLPSDPSSRRRHCLRLVLLVTFMNMNIIRFSYRGLSPHKFTPMPGVHKFIQPTPNSRLSFSVSASVAGSADDRRWLLEIKTFIKTIHLRRTGRLYDVIIEI